MDTTKDRIKNLIERYKSEERKCEKVNTDASVIDTKTIDLRKNFDLFGTL